MTLADRFRATLRIEWRLKFSWFSSSFKSLAAYVAMSSPFVPTAEAALIEQRQLETRLQFVCVSPRQASSHDCLSLSEAAVELRGPLAWGGHWHLGVDAIGRRIWNFPYLMRNDPQDNVRQLPTIHAELGLLNQETLKFSIGRKNPELQWFANHTHLLSKRYWSYEDDQLAATLEWQPLPVDLWLQFIVGTGSGQWPSNLDQRSYQGIQLSYQITDGLRFQAVGSRDQASAEVCPLCSEGFRHELKGLKTDREQKRWAMILELDGNMQPVRGLRSYIAIQSVPEQQMVWNRGTSRQSTLDFGFKWDILATYYLSWNFEASRIKATSGEGLRYCEASRENECIEASTFSNQRDYFGWSIGAGILRLRDLNLDFVLRRDGVDEGTDDSFLHQNGSIPLRRWSGLIKVGAQTSWFDR
jgi:hypothetical protein